MANPAVKEISESSSYHLDLIRSITAMAVAAGHIRSLFLIEYGAIAGPSIFHKILYFATGLGHQGVIIFFVLSGLLVGGSVLRTIRENRWSWGKYMSARLSRLYIVLIPGLFLTWIFDTVGTAMAKNPSVYAGSSIFGNIINFPIETAHTFKNFLGSLFFLQTIVTNPFGSNTPLWSLANEFWYYVLFPLCLFVLLKNKGSLLKKILVSFGILGIVFFIGGNISFLFPVWIFGVVAFIWQRGMNELAKKWRWLLMFLIAAQFLIILSISRFSLIKDPLLSDIIIGLSVAICFWGILSLSKNNFGERYQKVSRKMAGFSYTLYVVHLPLVIFIHSFINSKTDYFINGRVEPSATNIALIAAIFGAVLLFAYFVARFTENKTDLARRKISGIFQKISG